MIENLNTKLAEAMSALAEANKRLLEASQLVSHHRREEINATNKVNEAQRHFDPLVEELKESAPYGSDWKKNMSDSESLTAIYRRLQSQFRATTWPTDSPSVTGTTHE